MIVLKEANNQDVVLINQLAEQTFGHTYGEILSAEQLAYMFEMMYAPYNIIYQMEVDGHRYFIAYEGDKPCGYISFSRQAKDLYNLEKIYILPAFQGKGIGREMVEFAFGFVKKWNNDAPCRMELHVNRANKAHLFYEHMGMVVDRSGDFDIGEGYFMNDYIMAIDL